MKRSKKMTLLDHAETVLEKAEKPLSVQEIVASWTPPKGGKTPHNTLKTEIATKRKDSIIKVSPNRYWTKAKLEEARKKEVEKLAYDLWEKAGKPICDGVQFWVEAEKLVDIRAMGLANVR